MRRCGSNNRDILNRRCWIEGRKRQYDGRGVPLATACPARPWWTGNHGCRNAGEHTACGDALRGIGADPPGTAYDRRSGQDRKVVVDVVAGP